MTTFAAMSAVLAAVEAAFAAASIAVPDRVFVANSVSEEAAVTCESLFVAVQRTYAGVVGGESAQPARSGVVRVAELAVESWRCAPTIGEQGELPAAADITSSAATILADGDAIAAGVLTAISADTCSPGAFGAGQLIGPRGGFVGFQQRLTVQL